MNGMQCGSPALRERPFCYFHSHMLLRARRFEYTQGPIEDATSLHFALMRMLHALERGAYDPRTCSLMLRSLRLISANLKQYQLEQRADIEQGEDFVTELLADEEPESAQEEHRSEQPPEPHAQLKLLQERLRSAIREREQPPSDAPPPPSGDGAPAP